MKENTGKYKIEEIVERKNTENIPLLTCISDKSACLVFLNENGTVDDKEVLWSKDKRFLSWCNDFFDHYWNFV